jgi:phosphatidylinositol alpha-mannosyltransferase
VTVGPHVAVLCLEWPSPTRHVGGVGRYAYRLTRWLAAHTRISVVTGPDPQPLAGVELHPLTADHFSGQFHRYYTAPLAAASMVRRLRPAVVHSHGDDLALAWGPRAAPIIRTFYGRAAAEARSGRWQRRVNHALLSGMEHAARPRLTRIVGIGPDSVRAYRADALIPPVMPSDLPAFVGTRAPDPTVVFIGGFDGRKRGWLAVEVVSKARRHVGAIRLVVFGPEGDRTLYPDWVDFRAGASDDEIRGVLSEAWILLAPSTYEGFGIPAWEAMGAGAVVIGSPNPGLGFLAAGDGAIVVADDALEQAVTTHLTDDHARSTAGSKGRCRAEQIAASADPDRYLHLMMELV